MGGYLGAKNVFPIPEEAFQRQQVSRKETNEGRAKEGSLGKLGRLCLTLVKDQPSPPHSLLVGPGDLPCRKLTLKNTYVFMFEGVIEVICRVFSLFS